MVYICPKSGTVPCQAMSSADKHQQLGDKTESNVNERLALTPSRTFKPLKAFFFLPTLIGPREKLKGVDAMPRNRCRTVWRKEPIAEPQASGPLRTSNATIHFSLEIETTGSCPEAHAGIG